MSGGGLSRGARLYSVLANNAIFLEAKVVHGLVNRLLNLLPVRSSLNELVHVLEVSISTGKFQFYRTNHLRSVGSTVSRSVSYDLRKVLSVIHNEDVTEHLEMGEIRRDALNLVIAMRLRVL